MKKNILILCLMIMSLCVQAQGTATLTFDNASKRILFDTSIQVWAENDIVVTNKKSPASSNVADYIKPVRFYSGSEVVVEFTSAITKIDFFCNTEAYAKTLNESIGNSKVSGKIVTVELDGTSKTFVCSMTRGQVRLDSLTVTFDETTEEPFVGFPIPSVKPDVYTTVQYITFESDYKNVENPTINYYYTTDGSEPTKESTLVKGGVEVTESCIIKVVAVMTVEEKEYTSKVAFYQYIISKTAKYVAITNSEHIVAGEVLLVANNLAAHAFSGNYGYLPVHKVTVVDGCIENPVYYGTFKLEIAEGGWYIRDNNGKYLYMNETYNRFNVSEVIPEEGCVWDIAVNEDGTVKITNLATSKYIQYSADYATYGAYADMQESGEFPMLYAPCTGQGNEVTPDDSEGWNDISRPHRITLYGAYDSTTGLEGFVEYSVDGSDKWQTLSGLYTPGDTIETSVVVMFDQTEPTHKIKVRARDLVGDIIELYTIEYVDVSFHHLEGVEDMVYTGDSLYQRNVFCDLDNDCYLLTDYSNNINVGTASFNVEGVYPNSIGRKTYDFNIQPQPLSGNVVLSDSSFVYNGQPFTPVWNFSNEKYANLKSEIDYICLWNDNLLPGTGTLIVTGVNNYTGSLYTSVYIDKAQLADSLFDLSLPDEDITYDGQMHGASVEISEGVGTSTISYIKQGSTEMTMKQPIEAGEYSIYLKFDEGSLYYGRDAVKVGSFTIYQFDATEWEILKTVKTDLVEMGWQCPWELSQGIKCVSELDGINVEKGHIVEIDLSSQGLTGTFPQALLSFPDITSINLSDNRLSGDIATEICDYIGQDSVACKSISSLNISNNSYSGNVGLLAGCFPNLKELNASGNSFSSVSPMISTNVCELNLASQQLDGVIDFGQMTDIPEILLYDHANQTFRSEMPLTLTTAEPQGFDADTTDEWYVNMLFSGNSFKANGDSRNNIYRGGNGDMIYAILDNDESVANGSSIGMTFTFESGDANIVSGTDVSDLQTIILYMFNLLGGYAFNFTAADIYADGVITVQDIVCVVNRILSQSATPGKSMMKASRHFKEDAEAFLYIKDGKVVLSTEVPVAALSIKSDGSIEWALQQLGLEQAVLGGNVVGYSLSGATLPVGETVIGTCTGSTALNEAMLADKSATAICISLGGGDGTTSVEYTAIDECVDNEIYNAAGVRNDRLSRGINLIKSNGKVKKVLDNK